MKRQIKCTNNDLIILTRQITEFQEGCERASLILPAQISYMVHRNEQLTMQRYTKYEKKRLKLVDTFVEKDEKGQPKVHTVGEGENAKMQVVFKDEKAFEAAFAEMLEQPVELEFFVPQNIEDKIGDMTGEQKLLNQLWYLLEVFQNWDPANVNKDEDAGE